MKQLKAEQEAFADAAKKIDPNKPPIEVLSKSRASIQLRRISFPM